MKIAQVKEEEVKNEAFREDTWLHYWSNSNEEIEETDRKEKLIKRESKDTNDKADEQETKDKDGSRIQTVITGKRAKMQKSCSGNGKKTAKRCSQPIPFQEKETQGAAPKRSTNFLLKQRALEKAPVSETVSNSCEYQCPDCNKVCRTRDALTRHFQRSQHATSSVQRSVFNFMKKIVAHKCFFCTKTYMCEIAIIKDHLKKSHNVSVKVYCDKFKLRLISKGTNQQEFINMLTSLQGENNTTVKVVENLCKFNCKKCQYSSHSWASMQIHLKNKSHGSVLNPLPYMKKLVFHKCHICQLSVPCDYRLIFSHITSKHKIQISVYKNILSQEENLLTRYLKELKSSIQDIPTVKPQHHTTLNAHIFPDKLLTSNTGNISFFKCPACQKNIISFSILRHHCQTIHQIKGLSYNAKLVVEARYHECFRCQKIILCDNYWLRNHVRKCHKINLSEYVEKYVLKSGNKVFPTFKYYCLNNDIFKEFRQGPDIPCPSQETEDSGLISPDMISSESEDSD